MHRPLLVCYLLLWICNTNHTCTCIPYVWLYCGFQISWKLFLRRSGVILNHLQKGCSHWTPKEWSFCILGVLYHLSLLLVKQKKFQIWIHVYLNSPLNWVGYIHLYLYKFVLPRTRMSHGKRQKDYIWYGTKMAP